MISSRNNALIGKFETSHSKGHITKPNILNQFSSNNNGIIVDLFISWMKTFNYKSQLDFCKAVHLLCHECVNNYSIELHPIYAVGTLLRFYIDKSTLVFSVQDAIQTFLDCCAIEVTMEKRVCLLIGELTAIGVFNYEKFMQRLISRGILDDGSAGNDLVKSNN